MYKVIGMPRNRTLRVLWMLEELGEAYELETAEPRTEAVTSRNPSGKVPILEDDGAVLTDSVAIVQYLADKHQRFTAPAGTLARGRQDALTQFAVDEIEGPLWTIAKHKFVLPKEHRRPDIRGACAFEFAKAMRSLEARLSASSAGGPYAFGDGFTVPDLLLGHCARWARAAKIDIPAEGTPVATYFSAVTRRPALGVLDARYQA